MTTYKDESIEEGQQSSDEVEDQLAKYMVTKPKNVLRPGESTIIKGGSADYTIKNAFGVRNQ